MERHLASVKRITEVNPIEGADAIECAIVGGGWPVVIRKGEFEVGELAIFCEIDSFIPHELAPFLSKGKEPREFNGVKGERLRTIKLRGQLSQGLLLPDSVAGSFHTEGDDVTEFLGIQKWEKPIPACLRGQMRGNFPSFIRKTDQERIQNLNGKINWDDEYEVTIKLDGSSMTIWFKEGEWGVCSRNVDLKLDQEGNSFVDMAKRVVGNIAWPDNIAIQGELMGPGIQGNREGLKEHEFFVFDVWDISAQRYFEPSKTREFCDLYGLDHVPVLQQKISLREFGITSIADALYLAEGPSINNPVREGLVFKRIDGSDSFKAISNAFLLKDES
jgi:RNA ligase (TIGR02306 family)